MRACFVQRQDWFGRSTPLLSSSSSSMAGEGQHPSRYILRVLGEQLQLQQREGRSGPRRARRGQGRYGSDID